MPLYPFCEYKPPMYTITVFNDKTLYSTIDLCGECCNELTKWFRKDENQHG